MYNCIFIILELTKIIHSKSNECAWCFFFPREANASVNHLVPILFFTIPCMVRYIACMRKTHNYCAEILSFFRSKKAQSNNGI